MPRLLTCTLGVGEALPDGRVRLLDCRYDDLGAALRDGVSLEQLAGYPTASETQLSELTILPPVVSPQKIWGQGLAYRSHALEVGKSLPQAPRVFLISPSALVGDSSDIQLPAFAGTEVDYEGEVCVVIGKAAKHVAEQDGWSVVAGVTAGNDVSARDIQKGSIDGVVDPQMANVSMGKSLDTFKPLGPTVATLELFDNRDDIGLRTYVDGELRQEGRTADLIFSVPELVAFLSRRTRLEPGDVIFTGTPGGVGQGTGRFLEAGSVVRVEVDGVGDLQNAVVAAVTTEEFSTGRESA